VVEPVNPKPGLPPLVLVHGFGAFGDQWRFNLAPLAEAGYRWPAAASCSGHTPSTITSWCQCPWALPLFGH